MIDWLFYGSVLLLGISCVLWLIDTLHAWQDELDREMDRDE